MCTTKTINANDPGAIPQALQVLRTGGLVAFPTDTVYGLAADVLNPDAVLDIYRAKKRQPDKAIPILIHDFSQIIQVARRPNEIAEKLAQSFWPGPITLVVQKLAHIPEAVSSMATIGVRVPDHPVALALLQAAGPLAVSSANVSGGENRCVADQVWHDLAGRIDLILDGGDTPGGVPSTVVNCVSSDWRILRPGPITEDQISKLLTGNT